jgi:hypothetical protein
MAELTKAKGGIVMKDLAMVIKDWAIDNWFILLSLISIFAISHFCCLPFQIV